MKAGAGWFPVISLSSTLVKAKNIFELVAPQFVNVIKLNRNTSAPVYCSHLHLIMANDKK